MRRQPWLRLFAETFHTSSTRGSRLARVRPERSPTTLWMSATFNDPPSRWCPPPPPKCVLSREAVCTANLSATCTTKPRQLRYKTVRSRAERHSETDVARQYFVLHGMHFYRGYSDDTQAQSARSGRSIQPAKSRVQRGLSASWTGNRSGRSARPWGLLAHTGDRPAGDDAKGDGESGRGNTPSERHIPDRHALRPHWISSDH